MDAKDDGKLDISESDTEFEFNLNNYEEGEDYEVANWNREPTTKEIELCKPHIDELIEWFNPHGVVYLGKVAEKYTNPVKIIPIDSLDLTKHKRPIRIDDKYATLSIPTLSLYHPAYIARLEYKLLTVIKEAHKLDTFIERLHNDD
jgi:uracil-DNA glycosylase family 4